MDGIVVLPLAAGLLAAIGGACVGSALHASAWRRDAAARAIMPRTAHALLGRLSKGIRILRRPACALLGMASVRRIADEAMLLLEEHGIVMTPVPLVSVGLGGALLMGVLAALVSSSPVFGIAVACLALAIPAALVKRTADRQNLEMREKVPDVLRSFATCFRSGLSLMQTLDQASKEMGGRLGQVLRIAGQRLEMGAPPREALSVLQGNPHVPELSFVAVALDVQHQTGGSLAPVLESARESVDSELDLMRSLRVQTAQARLSASIVTLMPFALVALFSLMSPGFLSPFFSSFAGMALLALALAMQVTGVLIVRHMLAVDGRAS